LNAAHTDNVLLAREIAALERELSAPIARIVRRGRVQDADAFAIEALTTSDVVLVDACRLSVSAGRASIPLARRPVLFAILLTLARAWPEPVPRDALIQRAFDVRRANESHRVRLRVEVGRLRAAIQDLGVEPEASKEGYRLHASREVALLLPSSDDDGARLSMLLGDGAAWSAQSLAEHAGVSKRTAQRVLAALVERGNAVRIGTGRDVRYLRQGVPLASRMLLLGLLPKR
jgi:DNA-binding winged helix-turn-helix (wHTH) protein